MYFDTDEVSSLQKSSVLRFFAFLVVFV